MFVLIMFSFFAARGAVYRTVAKNGGEKELNSLQNRFRTTERAEERRMLLLAMAAFSDYQLMKQVLGKWGEGE